jgi:hypothetical protein
MTYFGSQATSSRLEMAVLTWSGAPSVNQPFSLTLLNHNWSPAPSVSSTSMTLPEGEYLAQAYSASTRTGTGQNLKYGWYVDGTLAGLVGQTDLMDGRNNDISEAVFSVQSSATLELRLVAQNSTLPTLTSDCRIVIWRVQGANVQEATL